MKKILLMMAAVVMLTACNGNKFSVEGTIEGANDSTTLILEQSSNGEWFIIDSIAVGKDGKYSVSAPAPEVPSIYQLRLGGQGICFPIDSLDHLTINAKLPNFATDYTVSGSDHAVQIMKLDKEALQFANGKGTDAELKAWKDKLSRQIVADPSGIVAYYSINKYINGKPLFDPLDDNDLRIIGAVANAFNSFRPDDPRTDYLVNVLLDGQRRRRSMSAPTDTLYADVASIIDIKLQDYHGKDYSLSKVAAENRVVLLDFTAYTAEFSPQINKLLNDIYQSYHSRGLEIYQVSLDQDNVAWRQSAENLPWITVFDPMSVNSKNVGTYNVTSIPTTFIIKGGDIVERIEDATNLKAAVAKYM
ncbi:MAG: AhpC/TSA family protein [Muribaculaceae bacterium]|nr:AhpC/TSA family protein [Muribaculaceae bacterium]